nr:hypothetical protein [Streptomyces sp. DSM 41633]
PMRCPWTSQSGLACGSSLGLKTGFLAGFVGSPVCLEDLCHQVVLGLGDLLGFSFGAYQHKTSYPDHTAAIKIL